MTNSFDTWLEDQLDRGYASFSSAGIPAGAPYRASVTSRCHDMKGRLAASVVLGFGTAALVTSAALASAALSGSPDPTLWIRRIADTISVCAAQGGQTGLGNCISTLTPPRSAPDRSGKGLAPGKAANGDQPKPAPRGEVQVGGQFGNAPGKSAPPGGPPTDKPAGPPTNKPAGPPTDHTGGPPTTPTGNTHARTEPNATPKGGSNGLAKGDPTGVHGKLGR